MPPKKKIVSVVGARPNFVKIASFLRAMESYLQVESLLVHTGQHYDPDLSDIFFRQLGIRAPDVNLEVGSGSHAEQTAQVMRKFAPVIEAEKPDMVVVVGDVNSTLACAITAKKLNCPVAHIEAGLRSFDNTMPEELNRRVTDLISDLHFTTTPEADANLRQENVPGPQIHLVGNLMIDSLYFGRPQAVGLDEFKKYGLQSDRYILLTLHRPGNVDRREVLQPLLDVFRELNVACPILFPAHPRTRTILIQNGWLKDTAGAAVTPYFTLIPPVGYLEMLNLQMNARLVLTDSGGLQEETTVLNIPCLTLRDNTERPETVTQGTNQVIGTKPEVILYKAQEVLRGQRKQGRCPELWDGQTGKRIAEILVRHLG